MADALPPRNPDPDLDAGDPPDAPGPVPHPDHHIGVPGAPSTNPPEAPLVPSAAGFGAFWNLYGPTTLLVLIGLVVVAVVLAGVGSD
jgi:hypothetical protein